MTKIPSLPVHVHSENSSTTRRTFLGQLAALSALPAVALPPSLSDAIRTYRHARDQLAALEQLYAVLAPEYDAFPNGSPEAEKLRRLESEQGRLLVNLGAAEKAIMKSLDESRLAWTIDGPELFTVADLEPEGVRRLIVVRA